MKKYVHILFCLTLSWSLFACGKQDQIAIQENKNSSLDIPQTPSTPPEDTTPPASSFKPSICSDLSFKNVQWPTELTEFHINIFALAMNISGSFEGTTGWTNISNNFDGQGVSLGLFNQNLGQGSLQPLMVDLATKNSPKMKSFYPQALYESVSLMLAKWQGVSNSGLTKVTRSPSSFEGDFSELDDPDAIAASGDDSSVLLQKSISSKNQVSVDWAVKTVFKGTSFKPEWKTAFQKMAGSPEFVTIQVSAAKAIHNRALGYMKKFGFKEMRAYFFFFDVVVQNGGISTSIADKYFAWEKSNKGASESSKLKKLLEYRLTLVITKYQQDVRSRKLAVINGSGVVHGDNRHFSEEYCAPQWTTVFPKSSL